MAATNRSAGGCRSVLPQVTASVALFLMTLAFWWNATPASAAPARLVARAEQADLAAVARQLPLRGSLRVEGVAFDGATTALELERFEAFTPDAQIVIAGERGDVVLPAPDNAYFRGGVEGDLGAVAVLTVRAQGGVRGLIVKNGVPWVIGADDNSPRPRGLAARQVNLGREFGGRTFRCGTEGELPSAPTLPETTAPESTSAMAAAVNYTARVAVETDYEFYQLFANETDATDYVGDLFAYASTIYEGETNTSLLVSYLRLWTTSADPWTTTTCDSGSTPGLLTEFRTYWNQNNAGISRTIAHMLSGKRTGCGQAYLGVLCNSSYGYGVSGSLYGNFNITSPTVVWDILVVSHEIGHNFNSPHTHCYNGIGGSSEPVDQCYGSEGGCYSGATSLPCALGPGRGCGTIMSYCHLLSGGYGNITMTFGTGFPYGVSPGRVPTRMHDHVVARAASYPSCLQLVPSGPTPTPTQTPARTSTSTPTATRTPTNPPTSTPTLTPTRVNTATSTITAAPTNTPTATNTPTSTNTSLPTDTPVPTNTLMPTNTPTPMFSGTLTATSTHTATATQTPIPSFTATPAPAARFSAVQDAWIDQWSSTQNNGRDISLRVQPSSRRLRRTLVQFNLSTVPPGTCARSALLKLTLTGVQSTSRTFAVHRLTNSWTEGTSKAGSGVTWTRRNGVQLWTVAGGDFVAAATAASPTGTLSGVTVQWDVTADVAGFLAGSAPNYGWLVKDTSEGSGGEFRFASRENSTAANQPRLEITYGACP